MITLAEQESADPMARPVVLYGCPDHRDIFHRRQKAYQIVVGIMVVVHGCLLPVFCRRL
jgi:hypothetical protein